MWINGLSWRKNVRKREVRLSGSIDACLSPVNAKYTVIRWRHCRLVDIKSIVLLDDIYFSNFFVFHLCLSISFLFDFEIR